MLASLSRTCNKDFLSVTSARDAPGLPRVLTAESTELSKYRTDHLGMGSLLVAGTLARTGGNSSPGLMRIMMTLDMIMGQV